MYNKAQLSKDRKLAKEPKKLARPKDIDYVSMMGYRDDSPFKDRPYIDINTPDGTIDMSNTGIDLIANGRFLPKYSGLHQFDTPVVREERIAEFGGTIMDLDDDEIALYRAGGYAIEELPQQDNGGVYSKDIQYPAKHNPANSFTVTDPRSMQDGGGYEIELTDEEIDQYRKGGYVVEELPQAQKGKTVKPFVTSDPYEFKLREAAYNDSLWLYKNNLTTPVKHDPEKFENMITGSESKSYPYTSKVISSSKPYSKHAKPTLEWKGGYDPQNPLQYYSSPAIKAGQNKSPFFIPGVPANKPIKYEHRESRWKPHKVTGTNNQFYLPWEDRRDDDVMNTMDYARFKKPVQPVVFQSKTGSSSKSKTKSKNTSTSNKSYNELYEDPPIYLSDPNDPRIGRYTEAGRQFLYKEPTKAKPVQSKPEVGKLPTKKLTQTPEIIPSNYNYTPQEPETIRTASRSQTVMEPDPNREGKFKVKELRQVPYSANFPGEGWLPMNAPRVMYYNPTTGEETEERFREGGLAKAQLGKGVTSLMINPYERGMFNTNVNAGAPDQSNFGLGIKRSNIFPQWSKENDVKTNVSAQLQIPYEMNRAPGIKGNVTTAYTPSSGRGNKVDFTTQFQGEAGYSPQYGANMNLMAFPHISGSNVPETRWRDDKYYAGAIRAGVGPQLGMSYGIKNKEVQGADAVNPGGGGLQYGARGFVEYSPTDWLKLKLEAQGMLDPNTRGPRETATGPSVNFSPGVNLSATMPLNYIKRKIDKIKPKDQTKIDNDEYRPRIKEGGLIQAQEGLQQPIIDKAQDEAETFAYAKAADKERWKELMDNTKALMDTAQGRKLWYQDLKPKNFSIDELQRFTQGVKEYNKGAQDYERARRKAQEDKISGDDFARMYKEKGWAKYDQDTMKEGYQGQFQDAADEAQKRKEANMAYTDAALEFTGAPALFRVAQDPWGTLKGVGNTVADLALSANPGIGAVFGAGDPNVNPLTGNQYWSGLNQTLDVAGLLPGIGALGKLGKQPLIKGSQKLVKNIPQYENVYRLEPTSFQKTSDLSGRWFTNDVNELPFYLKHLKDPESGVRIIKKKIPASQWEKVSGVNMSESAKAMSSGTGKYATYQDAANAGELSIGAAKRLSKDVPIPSDIQELFSNKNLINLTEGTLPEELVSKYRTQNPNKLASSWERIEFPQGDLGKEGAWEYIFNIDKQASEPLLGIPSKYLPMDADAIKGLPKNIANQFKSLLQSKVDTDDVVKSGIDGNFITRPLTPFGKNELTTGKQWYRKIGNEAGLKDLINKQGAQAPAPMKMKSGLMLDAPFFGKGTSPAESYKGLYSVEVKPEAASKYHWKSRVAGVDNYGSVPFANDRQLKNLPLEDLNVYRKKWFSNNYRQLDPENLEEGLKYAALQRNLENAYKWGIRGEVADQLFNDGQFTNQIMNLGNTEQEKRKGGYVDNQMTHFQDGGNMDPGNNALELHMFYDKNNFATGGTVEMMTDDEIKKYRDAGYVIIEEPDYE